MLFWELYIDISYLLYQINKSTEWVGKTLIEGHEIFWI